jgi:hypothetical protein
MVMPRSAREGTRISSIRRSRGTTRDGLAGARRYVLQGV